MEPSSGDPYLEDEAAFSAEFGRCMDAVEGRICWEEISAWRRESEERRRSKN